MALSDGAAPAAPLDPTATDRSFDLLLNMVCTTPIPTTPLVQLRHVEEQGLTLLELGTRLSHVVRKSENLGLTDKSHLRRVLTLDVDLSTLAERHFHALTRHPNNIDLRTEIRESTAEQHLWVPIATQTRRELAPIVVRDSKGEVLPRMASNELTAASSAALIRLFRMLLEASPEVTRRSDELYRLQHELHRSRWLIEAAIRRLIVEGTLHGAIVTRASSTHDSAETEAEGVRNNAMKAIDILKQRQHGAFGAFLELLSFSAQNYPLTVLLPRTSSPLFLQFDAPAISADEGTRTRNLAQHVAQITSPVRAFPATYETSVSKATTSFHLALDVDEQLHVRRFIASTNADDPLVESLVQDMRGVAERYTALQTAGEKILENELQSIAERLSDLGLRRSRESDAFREYLKRLGAKPRQPRTETVDGPAELLDLLITTRKRPIKYLQQFATEFHGGHLTKLVGVLTPQRLEALATRIIKLQLGRDLLVDNDPREHGGHIYWHQRGTNRDERALEPVVVRVMTALVDDPPSLGGSVARMLLALAATVFGVFYFLFGGTSWALPTGDQTATAAQADAIVTVLLLVPGLLLTRLDIPATNTVLGEVRSQNRLVAYVAFAVPAALAVYVAASSTIHPLVPAIGFGGLILLIAVNTVGELATRWDARQTVTPSKSAPTWVRREFPIRIASRFAPRAVTFNAGEE